MDDAVALNELKRIYDLAIGAIYLKNFNASLYQYVEVIKRLKSAPTIRKALKIDKIGDTSRINILMIEIGLYVNKVVNQMRKCKNLPSNIRNEVTEIIKTYHGELPLCICKKDLLSSDQYVVLHTNEKFSKLFSGLTENVKNKAIYEKLGIKFYPSGEHMENKAEELMRRYEEAEDLFLKIRATRPWHAWEQLQERAKLVARDDAELKGEDHTYILKKYKPHLACMHGFVSEELKDKKQPKAEVTSPLKNSKVRKTKGLLLKTLFYELIRRNYANREITNKKWTAKESAKILIENDDIKKILASEKIFQTALNKNPKSGDKDHKETEEIMFKILDAKLFNLMNRRDFKKTFAIPSIAIAIPTIAK